MVQFDSRSHFLLNVNCGTVMGASYNHNFSFVTTTAKPGEPNKEMILVVVGVSIGCLLFAFGIVLICVILCRHKRGIASYHPHKEESRSRQLTKTNESEFLCRYTENTSFSLCKPFLWMIWHWGKNFNICNKSVLVTQYWLRPSQTN